MSIRFVLFDAVGTLIRVEPSVAELYFRVAQRHGSRLTLKAIRDRFADAFRQYHVEDVTSEPGERSKWRSVVDAVLVDLADSETKTAAFEELWETFSQADSWRLFPDVADVWETLGKRGYLLGIASNFDQRLLKLCQRMPPLDSAHQVLVSSGVGFAKPHPQFFRKAQQVLGCRPNEILLVGDSVYHDYDGAIAAGWNAVLIDRSESQRISGSIGTLRELLERL